MEKILVGLKRVVDYNVRVRVKGDGSGVETDGVKMSINPFDEIALEEALRMREAGQADEVIVVSIGGNECQQQLRTGRKAFLSGFAAGQHFKLGALCRSRPVQFVQGLLFFGHQPAPQPRLGETVAEPVEVELPQLLDREPRLLVRPAVLAVEVGADGVEHVAVSARAGDAG